MMRTAPLRWQQADPVLVLAALGLSAYGILLVTSATWQYYDQPSLLGNSWFIKQALFSVVGFAAMVLCAMLHPRTLRTFAYPAYALALLPLVAVLFFGHGSEDYGARRWMDLGAFQLQPSEPMKLALVIALARALDTPRPGIREFLLSSALTAVPFGLIFLQPDLGTGLVMLAIWFGSILLAGVPRRLLLGVVLCALVAAPLVWFGPVLKDYQRSRIMIFLDPASDPRGEGYNILQAKISIGSGGMRGKGLLAGTQTQLRYLRVSQSDFIFSVLGEELGFVGAVGLFGLFLLLLFRIIRAFELADEPFTSLLCAGVVSMIAFQSIANIAANLGLTPVVGIPLPFVSHGGSALITQLVALGLVLATLVRHRRYRFQA
jgi:rod shape determining protein RodA